MSGIEIWGFLGWILALIFWVNWRIERRESKDWAKLVDSWFKSAAAGPQEGREGL